MKVLAVVPARSGSKRLPGKNIRLLDGLPLIAWTLRAAHAVAAFCDVVVSTDSEEIAGVARAHGGSVPWLRPSGLAQDSSTAVDVLLHAVSAWESASGQRVDGVCLLQPTSPFRTRQSLHDAIAQFCAAGGRSVVGVSPASPHPDWCFRMLPDGHLESFLPGDGLMRRSQELSPAYAVNGFVYLVSRDYLMSGNGLYTKPMLPAIITDPVESIDIDTPFDWAVAERFAPQVNGEFNE